MVAHLPRRLAELAHIFDEIAIEPRNRPSGSRVTAGPFFVAEYQRGQFLRLERNPHYWKHDQAGNALPYLPSIRVEIVANAEQELIRVRRGLYQVLDHLAPDSFSLLHQLQPEAVHDLGPSLNTEQLWFNQAPLSALPAFEKVWFGSTAFRVAVSQAIHRSDLARLAYAGHATPAYGFVSPANAAWYDRQLSAPREDAVTAAALPAPAGFHRGETGAHALLYDKANHPVRFSILTNAGNAPRQRMATLIQQDLAALGMEVTVVTLDFPALIERLMHTQDYEVCLLGLSNVDPDPNSMLNLWLSSSPNHQWNPSEKTPATPWGNSIDVAMRAQASTAKLSDRVRAVKEVQEIVAAEQPFIYLVYPNVLYALSPALAGLDPSVLQPVAVWTSSPFTGRVAMRERHAAASRPIAGRLSQNLRAR